VKLDATVIPFSLEHLTDSPPVSHSAPPTAPRPALGTSRWGILLRGCRLALRHQIEDVDDQNSQPKPIQVEHSLFCDHI
jgi:hypothetical protein